jgi:hypothetical protein
VGEGLQAWCCVSMSCFHCDSVGCGCPDADLRSFEETLRLQGLYQDPEGSTGGGAYEGSAVSGGEPEAVARPTVSVSYGRTSRTPLDPLCVSVSVGPSQQAAAAAVKKVGATWLCVFTPRVQPCPFTICVSTATVR